MPTITIDSPWQLASLRAYLTTRNDVVTAASTADSLEVTILGSYTCDKMRAELASRARVWERGQRARGIDVSLTFDEPVPDLEPAEEP
jgi:hypothetical protein